MSPSRCVLPGWRCVVSVVELACGVDALYLSGRAELPESLLDRLEVAKLGAQASSRATPLMFGGYDWTVASHGLLKWSFRLDHPLAVIGVTRRQHLPAFRVQARSEALHSMGADGFMRWLTGLLYNEGLPTRFTVSRIDLHADWQGWELTGDLRHRFVYRAHDLATYEADFELSGFSFGNRKSGAMVARIYDKTREIAGNGHDWWIELWGDAYDPVLPVIRVEFQFAPECLKEMGLTSPEDVLNAVGNLWAYGSREWLTYRLPSEHERTARWPISPEWEQVQACSLAQGCLPFDRITAGGAKGGLRLLMPLLNGCIASFAMWMGAATIADACAWLPAALGGYEATSGKTFAERIEEKRRDRR